MAGDCNLDTCRWTNRQVQRINMAPNEFVNNSLNGLRTPTQEYWPIIIFMSPGERCSCWIWRTHSGDRFWDVTQWNQRFTDISKEHIASIFRNEEYLLFNTEVGERHQTLTRLYGVVSFGASTASVSPRRTFAMMTLLITGSRGGFRRQAADKSCKDRSI